MKTIGLFFFLAAVYNDKRFSKINASFKKIIFIQFEFIWLDRNKLA